MAKAGRGDDQYMVRFPNGMRDRVKAAASDNRRSMNDEIIDRLERSLRTWPSVTLPADLQEAGLRATPERRQQFDEQLSDKAADLAFNIFRRGDQHVVELLMAFYDLAHDVSEPLQNEAAEVMMQAIELILPELGEEASYSVKQYNAARQMVGGVRAEEEAELLKDGGTERSE